MKLIGILLLLEVSSILFAQNSLIVPNTLSGNTFNLNLQNGTFEFYPGISTTTMGVNGNILGPTLIFNKGDFVNISVNNQLADTTTIHWHGLHVSAANDGGPHTTIPPGTLWNPSFTVLDHAGTYWYHPHLHEKTNLHVSKGIAGFIIVRDSEEAALELPRTYGVDDFPLVIQTKTFDSNSEIVVPSNSDSVVMVNATIDALLNLPAQVVRLRLLNGSSQRVLNLGLSDNISFFQIGSDGGLLNQPLELTRLQLSPGERAEILLDLNSFVGQTIYLKSYASEFPNGIYGATYPGMGPGQILQGYNPNPINGTDFQIMEFNVISPNGNPISNIPTSLVNNIPFNEADADITRNLTLTPQQMGPNVLNGKFLINNSSFNMDIINYTIPFNNIEIWSITNQSPIAHPFHIHDVQFYILDRNGVIPSPSEQGRKDVVLVKAMENVRFITKFEDFANDDVPYMYHCHMLTHEDQGMMGQFSVVDPTPVELIYFTANVNGSTVILNWSTATETNNAGFEIERKTNKKWENISFIQGQGSISVSHTYSYRDNLRNQSLNGEILYRLKQIDYDGSFSYSEEINFLVDFLPKEIKLRPNYPNPFNPVTMIEFYIPNESLVELSVYNLLGQKVAELINKRIDAGSYSINFDAKDLPSGVYLYELNSGTASLVKKMTLMK